MTFNIRALKYSKHKVFFWIKIEKKALSSFYLEFFLGKYIQLSI